MPLSPYRVNFNYHGLPIPCFVLTDAFENRSQR